MVLLGEVDDCGVLENQRGIAARQVAAEDSLTAEKCPREGTIDLTDEQLVVPSAGTCENERRTTYPQAGVVAAHPIGLITRRNQEFGDWRRWRRQSAANGNGDDGKRYVAHQCQIYGVREWVRCSGGDGHLTTYGGPITQPDSNRRRIRGFFCEPVLDWTVFSDTHHTIEDALSEDHLRRRRGWRDGDDHVRLHRRPRGGCEERHP